MTVLWCVAMSSFCAVSPCVARGRLVADTVPDERVYFIMYLIFLLAAWIFGGV